MNPEFKSLIGAFCLGFSLAGIFGFLDGTMLALSIVLYMSYITDIMLEEKQ